MQTNLNMPSGAEHCLAQICEADLHVPIGTARARRFGVGSLARFAAAPAVRMYLLPRCVCGHHRKEVAESAGSVGMLQLRFPFDGPR